MDGRSTWWPAILWAVFIIGLTSLPAGRLPQGPAIPGIDKLVHFTLYAVLGVLVGRGAGSRVGALAAIATMAAFGGADEWHQQWVPGRSADIADWMADAAGAASGFAFQRARVRQERSS